MKTKTFEVYKDYLIRDVPPDNLRIIVTGFIDDAALTLGCKPTKADVDKVSEFMSSNQFNFLPMSVAATAFIRGSLGKLKNDKSTLSPRNIYEWLSEVSLEFRQYQEHKERDERLSANNIRFSDLDRYPLGKAINKKIDWLKTEAITSEEWDMISLKELAELIGKGVWPTPEYFGITPKN